MERQEAQERLREVQQELICINTNLEQTVQERTAKLQRALEEMEHFSYAIVHDMRAPLRAIQGFAELVSKACTGCQDALSQDYLGRIKIATTRMDRLITDSLNYSKTLCEAWSLDPVDIRSLLRDLVETYPNLCTDKAEIRIEGDFPICLGNEAALAQCFGNLLDNAAKFAKPGTRAVIRVWAESQGAESGGTWAENPQPMARIWVVDNGIGIPRGVESRIFDMFQRGIIDQEGTGIGLAIVRKIVDRLGGKVGVESIEGQGSRFWIDLRRASLPTPLSDTG